MNQLRCTLLTDGPSDQILLDPLVWLLRKRGVTAPIQREWADLRALPKPPRGLEKRIPAAVDLYPCDLLFVHRDAEREPRESRVSEIQQALETLSSFPTPVACVVPVRMQEAWLLFDEAAIRAAAGNPNGRMLLHLPSWKEVESLPDPKETLNELLKRASGLTGRRLRQLNLPGCARRVAQFIDDFSPLERLSAFAALGEELAALISEQGWASDN